MLQMNNGKIGGENEDDIQVPISSNERKLTAISKKVKRHKTQKNRILFYSVVLACC